MKNCILQRDVDQRCSLVLSFTISAHPASGWRSARVTDEMREEKHWWWIKWTQNTRQKMMSLQCSMGLEDSIVCVRQQHAMDTDLNTFLEHSPSTPRRNQEDGIPIRNFLTTAPRFKPTLLTTPKRTKTCKQLIEKEQQINCFSAKFWKPIQPDIESRIWYLFGWERACGR